MVGVVVPTGARTPPVASTPAPPGPGAGPAATPGTSSTDEASAGFDPVARVFSTLFPSGKGRRIVWGVFQQPVDAAGVPDADERARRREVAAAQLVNIDADERDRRKQARYG